MNGVGAAKVLMSHLPEITDGAYKIATEIAIEIILQDAVYNVSARKPMVFRPWDEWRHV